ncbi:TPA: PadR family transcriptional regulator [Candidatus Micrarchaeota archaeon]|nr:PadR family transcriptional regulator [Candidatus Micrarchaeota archaeon]
MRGFLSFLILWLLNKKPMNGAELASEIEKRKGFRPNPGTIYPALKELTIKKVIIIKAGNGNRKIYTITPNGKEELEIAKAIFLKTFYDVISK